MDEGIAEKVDRMKKIIMAATADAWLIHLPGTVRSHEVFTAELLAMDRSNVEDLVAMMQDSTEDNEATSRTLSSSPCFLNSTGQESPTDRLWNSSLWQEAMSEPRNSSLLLLYVFTGGKGWVHFGVVLMVNLRMCALDEPFLLIDWDQNPLPGIAIWRN
jgi:hypothetical protein